MKRYTNKLWGALLPLLMTGCNTDTAWNGTDVAQGTAIRLLVQSSSDPSSEQEELQLNDVRAYRFADGTLQEVFGPMTPGKDGLCYLDLYREQTLTGRVVLALEPHPEDAAATGTSGF